MTRPARTASRRIKQAARRAAEAMMRLPGVTHATVGEKCVAGKPSGRLALKVHVLAKGSVPATQRIAPVTPLTAPDGSSLGEIETDVVEVGEAPEALGLSGGEELITNSNQRGTCAFAFDKAGTNYAMTNAHVVLDVASGAPVRRADWLRRQGRVQLGPPRLWSPVSAGDTVVSDYAAVAVPGNVACDLFWIEEAQRRIDEFGYVEAGYDWHWFAAQGGVHTCRRPEWVATDTPLNIDGSWVTYRDFWQFDMVSGPLVKGMSGASVNRTLQGSETTLACGLLFGGIRSAGKMFAFQILPAYEKLMERLPD